MFFHQATHNPIATIKSVQKTLKLLEEIDVIVLQNNLNTIYAHQKMINHDYQAINTRIKNAHSSLLKASDLLEDAIKWCFKEALGVRLEDIEQMKFFLSEATRCLSNPNLLLEKGTNYVKNYLNEVSLCINQIISFADPQKLKDEAIQFLLNPIMYIQGAMDALEQVRQLIEIENEKRTKKTPYQEAFTCVQSVLDILEEGFDLLSDSEKRYLVEEGVAEIDAKNKISLKFSCPISWGLIVQPVGATVTKNNENTVEIFEAGMLNRHLQKFKKMTGRWPSFVQTPASLTIHECGFSETLNQSHCEYLLNLYQKIKSLFQNKLLAEFEYTQQSVMRQRWS